MTDAELTPHPPTPTVGGGGERGGNLLPETRQKPSFIRAEVSKACPLASPEKSRQTQT